MEGIGVRSVGSWVGIVEAALGRGIRFGSSRGSSGRLCEQAGWPRGEEGWICSPKGGWNCILGIWMGGGRGVCGQGKVEPYRTREFVRWAARSMGEV